MRYYGLLEFISDIELTHKLISAPKGVTDQEAETWNWNSTNPLPYRAITKIARTALKSPGHRGIFVSSHRNIPTVHKESVEISAIFWQSAALSQ